MYEGLQTLNARELEVLRQLLVGHDAKSIARLLDISIHMVNERLRSARRKLGVSSSREAARLLAEAEQQSPRNFGDEPQNGRAIHPAPEFSQTAPGAHASGGAPAADLAAGSRWMPPKDFGHVPRSTNFIVPNGIGISSAASLPQSMAEGREGDRLSLIAVAGGMITMLMTAVLLFTTGAGADPGPQVSLPPQMVDVMSIADGNGDGVVTLEEYRTFSEQGWSIVAQGKDKVRLAELDQMAQLAFVGLVPDADGVITRQMYIKAIPGRFTMFDHNGDGLLDADEINGRSSLG